MSALGYLLYLWYRTIAQLRLIQLVNWNIIWWWSTFVCFLLPRLYLWFYRLSFTWETCKTPGYPSYGLHLDLCSDLAWRCLWNAAALFHIFLLIALFLSNTSCLHWGITASWWLLTRQVLPLSVLGRETFYHLGARSLHIPLVYLQFLTYFLTYLECSID